MIPNLKIKKITNYFSTTGPANTKARTLADTTTEHTKITTPVDISESDLEKQSQTTNDWPDCWIYDQKNDFCLKNEWLYVCKMKLGCTPCSKVGASWHIKKISDPLWARKNNLLGVFSHFFSLKATSFFFLLSLQSVFL